MTTEQKAQAYDKALERAKKVHKYSSDIAEIKRMEHIFPELRESEDESTRKRIIALVNAHGQGRFKESMLAWLEKQDEQKNKINSCKITFEDILALECSMKTAKITEGGDKLYEILVPLYNKIHNAYLAEKQDEQKVPVVDFKAEDWYVSKVDGKIHNIYHSVDKVQPKFHEGEWVVDNCDNVWKIEGILNQFYILEDIEGGESRPNIEWTDKTFHLWSIKDAKDGDVLFAENFDNIGGCVFLFKGLDSWKFDAEGDRAIATGYCCTSITESGNTDFGIQGPDCVEIKRVHPATKEQRDLLFQKMHEAGYMWNEEKKELEKIESTRPMLSDFFNAEYERGKADALQSIEWSEEDEKTLNEIFSVAARASLRKSTLFGKSYDYIKWQNWLKSLRDRVQLQPKQEWSEQRHVWKPSEDQMRALHDMNLTGNISYVGQGQTLIELYNDLKKL